MSSMAGISYFPALLLLMAATSTTAAYGPYSQFHRDRRAIRARTMATGEDHITHASIKMRMLNEGRSQVAVNPVRAKRFINAASGIQQKPKVSEAFKEYAGNQYGQVFPGKERASELVDQIQHGYVQPPRAPFPKNAVYEDLLTRQRKDGRDGHLSRKPENLGKMKDEVDDFLQLMHEMGILEDHEDDVSRGNKQQRNTGDATKSSSAASFVNHQIHRPDQTKDMKSNVRQDISSGYINPQRSSRVVHSRSPIHEEVAVKRESSQSLVKDTLDDEDVDDEVVGVEEEAIINIPPQALAKSDIDIDGLDLDIIKKLLEEIIARKSSK
nr:uncharacterized protein LOC129275535 [Lytechinus pictus]